MRSWPHLKAWPVLLPLTLAVGTANAANTNAANTANAMESVMKPLALQMSLELSSAPLPASPLANTSINSPTSQSASPAVHGLQVILARALPRDPQVQIAQAALASAQARYRQARSRLFPNLSLQANNGRSTDLDGRITVERSTRQVEAGLRWNLYRGGADAAEMAASEFEVDAATADLRRASEESAARLAEAYFDAQRLARTLNHAKVRLAQVTQLVAQVALQKEAGKLSELDWQQAQNAQLEAELAEDTLASDYRSAQIKLCALAMQDSQDQAARAWFDDLTDFTFKQIAVSDTSRNAQQSAAQARAAAARLRVRNWAETFAPKVDLDLRRLLSNQTTPPPSTVQQRGWSIGINWDFPLGGENIARRDESISRAAQAQAEIERAELETRTEFDALAPRITNLQRSIVNLAEQEQKMQLLLRGSAIQFEAGRRNLQQIIQSHDGYFNLQQRQQEQRHRLLLAQMRKLALAGRLLEGLDLPAGS